MIVLVPLAALVLSAIFVALSTMGEVGEGVGLLIFTLCVVPGTLAVMFYILKSKKFWIGMFVIGVACLIGSVCYGLSTITISPMILVIVLLVIQAHKIDQLSDNIRNDE